MTPAQPPSPTHGLRAITESVNSVASRLSVLEERMANLRRKTQVTEKSLIDYERETRADLKAYTQSVTELAHKVEQVKERLDAIAGELQSVVRKPDVAVLERYMDLWQPLDFVTREEARMLIEQHKKSESTKVNNG